MIKMFFRHQMRRSVAFELCFEHCSGSLVGVQVSALTKKWSTFKSHFTKYRAADGCQYLSESDIFFYLYLVLSI